MKKQWCWIPAVTEYSNPFEIDDVFKIMIDHHGDIIQWDCQQTCSSVSSFKSLEAILS